jgi:DNA-directed RNA polymerase subunit RPC12/RpoP/uncharacterized membrane protein YgcG
MKCIRCGTDSKYSERSGGACPKCHGRFAFEPRNGDPFTDAAFQYAIDAVSAKGQVRWGAEHLYYELARRQRRKLGCAVVGTTVFAVAALIAAANAKWIAVLLALIAAAFAAYVWRARTHRFVKLEQGKFDALLKTWQNVHGAPKSMIVRAMTRGMPAPPRALDADIADYSFDRAVICDRARTADVLLANNFHFENNCAVLALDGYPEAQFETVRAMLKRNPRLRVFALHDATPKGCRLAHTLATDAAWFAGQAAVTDVGLRPDQVGAFSGLYRPHREPPVQAGSGISRREAAWLSAQELELAVIRPEQVLKRLYKALSRKDGGDGDGGGGGGGGGDSASNSGEETTYDRESFTHEASDVDGDGDGFG